MTSASSSASSLSSTERKNEKYINPSTGQVETKHTESKPKQVVENLVSKVKSTFSKEKTDEHSHQAGGASRVPPGNNVNDPMMHHGQQNKGMAGAAGGVAGAAAGAYKGAADRQHVGGVRPDQQTGHAAEHNVHNKERHGGMASNAAAKAGAAAGAVEGAASRGAEKVTGRPRDTHGEQNVGMTTNPYGNKSANDPMGQQTNNPMGQKTNDPMGHKTNDPMHKSMNDPMGQKMSDPMHQRQGGIGQQMKGSMNPQTNNPMDQQTEDPMNQQMKDPMTQRMNNPMGNVALDSRAGGQF